MSKLYTLVIFVVYSAFSLSLSAQNPMTDSTDVLKQQYQQKKKAAKGMIISGSVGMAGGIILGSVGAAKATEEIVGLFAMEDPDENRGEAELIAGTVLFLGGAGLLVAGLVTNGKANQMKNEGLIYLRNSAPPLQLAGNKVSQQGITVGFRMGRSK